jgi:hypothetical protein
MRVFRRVRTDSPTTTADTYTIAPMAKGIPVILSCTALKDYMCLNEKTGKKVDGTSNGNADEKAPDKTGADSACEGPI